MRDGVLSCGMIDLDYTPRGRMRGNDDLETDTAVVPVVTIPAIQL